MLRLTQSSPKEVNLEPLFLCAIVRSELLAEGEILGKRHARASRDPMNTMVRQRGWLLFRSLTYGELAAI